MKEIMMIRNLSTGQYWDGNKWNNFNVAVAFREGFGFKVFTDFFNTDYEKYNYLIEKIYI